MYKWNDYLMPKAFKQLHRKHSKTGLWRYYKMYLCQICFLCTFEFKMFVLQRLAATKKHVFCCVSRGAHKARCDLTVTVQYWTHLHAQTLCRGNYILSRHCGIHGNIQLPDTEKTIREQEVPRWHRTHLYLSSLTFMWSLLL